jgi:hypothetical protein
LKNADTLVVAQQTFVVTAIFVKQMTVTAKSVSHAQDVAEQRGLLQTDGTDLSLSNWHGHKV